MAVSNPNFWAVVRDASHPCHSKEAEAERQRFFEMIRPAGNWKMPISARIEAEHVDDCNQACIWFTGAPLVVEGTMPDGKLWVQAPGYYATIGA